MRLFLSVCLVRSTSLFWRSVRKGTWEEVGLSFAKLSFKWQGSLPFNLDLDWILWGRFFRSGLFSWTGPRSVALRQTNVWHSSQNDSLAPSYASGIYLGIKDGSRIGNHCR